MDIKPSAEQAMARLRIDGSLSQDLGFAIDEAHSELIHMLDRDALYEDGASLTAAIEAAASDLEDAQALEDEDAIAAAQSELDRIGTGMAVTPDLITAQLLLIDVRVGSNGPGEAQAKQQAAQNIVDRHRRVGT